MSRDIHNELVYVVNEKTNKTKQKNKQKQKNVVCEFQFFFQDDVKHLSKQPTDQPTIVSIRCCSTLFSSQHWLYPLLLCECWYQDIHHCECTWWNIHMGKGNQILSLIFTVFFLEWHEIQVSVRHRTTLRHSLHYNDVIMSAIASQIASLTDVYLTVYSGADKRKH